MAQVQCELTIIKLTNLDLDHLPHGKLFIRYYVYAGGGTRIRIDTREIPCTSNPHWDETATLECQNIGSDTTKTSICSRNVVFELRLRRPYKSKLLGIAEVAWTDAGALEERQVDFAMKKSVTRGVKVPTLFVRMGIRVGALEPWEMTRKEHYEECRCESCKWIGGEEDMFVAATMIDAC